MRTTLLATLVLTVFAADALAQQRGERSRRRSRDVASVELENFTFERVEFAAPSLASGKTELGVYLPSGYADEGNADRAYPLVVWLHGMRGSYARFHFEGGAEVMDRMRGEGKIPELILVAATAPRRTIYANGESLGDIEDLITTDLIGYVEKNFRVSKKRSERAIMGVSIGGMGALRIAFKFPERFGVVAAHSAAMFPADPKDIGDGRSRRMIEGQIRAMGWQELLGDPIDPKKWAKLIPTAMAATMKPADFKGLRIYFDAGSADRYGFGPPNVAFHEQLEKQGIAHSFHYFDGGGHAWGTGSTQRALVDSLAFVGATFEKSAEATAKSAAHDGGK